MVDDRTGNAHPGTRNVDRPDSPVGFMVSAPRKSSGKTTLTIGLSAALIQYGLNVRVFKKGPDYIDPMWHKLVTGQPCYNIDPYWMPESMCREIFTSHVQGMNVCLVEGNHGLHDGLDLKGTNSTAHLAKLLKIPVVLIVDASGTNRGIAATVLGQQKMDPDVTIAGVVLNNSASVRQMNKQIAAIDYYCGLPVFGAIPKNLDLRIKERHLGLVTIHEADLSEEMVSAAKQAILDNCDLKAILAAAGTIQATESEKPSGKSAGQNRITIGVASDKAFCFYYEHNLEALREAGAELVFFDTLNDEKVPDVQALYIGGGFPESFVRELERNVAMRSDLKNKIENGLPVYAECGGLMYLTRSIIRDGTSRAMVGVLPADVEFVGVPIGKGYVELEGQPGKSWFFSDRIIRGHEFHYSRLKNVDPEVEFIYQVKRGTGIKPGLDGMVYKNVIAAYSHIHSKVVPEWAEQFVNFARSLNGSI